MEKGYMMEAFSATSRVLNERSQRKRKSRAPGSAPRDRLQQP